MENQEIYTQELDKIGSLMTVEDWRENIKYNMFIDGDGFGRAVKDKKMTKKSYYPSQENKIPKDATHIMWYNK